MSKYKDEMWNITEVEIYVSTPPEIKEDRVFIDSIGEFVVFFKWRRVLYEIEFKKIIYIRWKNNL